MLEYKIISSPIIIEFEEAVSRALNEGWQCQGGVCVFRGDRKTGDTLPSPPPTFSQAVTRRIERQLK